MSLPYYLFATFGEIPNGSERLKVIGFQLCYIEYVLELPAIDLNLKKPRFVYWCGAETGQQLYGKEGTGDDQIWALYPGASFYVPLIRLSYKSGIPSL